MALLAAAGRGRVRIGAPERRPTKELRPIDQSVVNGAPGELQTVGHAELVEDVVQVVFYGLFADEQLFADSRRPCPPSSRQTEGYLSPDVRCGSEL